MIVKNEAAIIWRCLESVADIVDCYVIGDTGSTDDTQKIIKEFFDARGIYGIITEFPFHDFAQARNAALEAAEASDLDFDYILFADADMELIVTDASFKDRLDFNGYMVEQAAANGLTYSNIRVIKRGIGAQYVGVTHEYCDVHCQPVLLSEIRYFDHACGSNRIEKTERDIRLLRAGLESDPDNHRYKFYLAQTLYEKGDYEEARKLYAERAAAGGFEEEAWFSVMANALAEQKLGNEEAFIAKILAAYQRRPTRSEPLYHLAVHYLKKGHHDLACLICEEGMRIKQPKDILFVEKSIYDRGFLEIFSICGYYSRGRRARAFEATNWLTLAPRSSRDAADIARANMPHYLVPLSVYLDSWKAQKIELAVDDGWFPLNPSIANINGWLDVVARTVNYEVQFGEQGVCYVTQDGAPIITRNMYLRLNDDLTVIDQKELLPPEDMPEPRYKDILGFEDLRLVSVDGQAFVNGTCCELEENGHRNMVRAKIDGDRLSELTLIIPDDVPRQVEKNWGPFVKDGKLQYLYSYGPTRVVDMTGATVSVNQPEIRAEGFRGGSQLIPFEDGLLCCIHEVSWNSARQKRTYYHRMVLFNADMVLSKVSPPFVFNHVRYEFCAGLAWHKDGKRLVFSYGVDDKEAWLGTVNAAEVMSFMQDVASFK
jgi:glycosyltransferase involved in cell wall biosynthesis/predicted GH43/DUF377 family glycosyl hydrolase